MSNSERDVLLTTDNPAAEILLLDGDFRVVARGASPLKTRVPQGIYVMKVRVGDEQSEEVMAIGPGDDAWHRGLPGPEFESPVPLSRTSTSHEFHQHLTRQASAFLAQACQSSGSAVLVCVRDPSRFQPGDASAQRREPLYKKAFARFSLAAPDGSTIARGGDVETELELGYLSLMTAVPPGGYALQYRTRDQALCIPLIAVVGRSLQLFINLVPAVGGDLVPDFENMAVFYQRAGEPFEPWRDDLRAAETVRKSLLRGRTYIEPDALRELYDGKFENPMLGLYAAHHLLRTKRPMAELQVVIENTGRMLGETFPDVIALQAHTRKGEPNGARIARLRRLEGPPLLALSWDLLLQEAADLPPGAVDDVAVFAIGSRLDVQGLFVAWRTQDEETGVRPFGAAAALAVGDKAILEAAVPLPAAKRRASPMSLKRPAARAAPEAIKGADAAGVAAALTDLARKFDWSRLTETLRRNPRWTKALSPLQRSLILALDRPHDDEDERPVRDVVVPASYVEDLLRTYRVPLHVLQREIAQLRAGGWIVGAVDAAFDSADDGRRTAQALIDSLLRKD